MGGPNESSLPKSVTSKAAVALGLARNSHAEPVLPISTNPGKNGLRACSTNTLTEKPISGDGIHNNRDTQAHTEVANNKPFPCSDARESAANGVASATLEPEKLPVWSSTRIKNGSLRFLTHTKNALTWSWINVLLVFVPVGIAVRIVDLNPAVVFSMNAIAIIPLAGLLAHATETVAVRVGDTWGALLNVSFGNAVELILFIILLQSNQLAVVQASLVGSVLANLLLILGMAFFLGGLKYQEQVYNNYVTQVNGVMLALAVMSLLIPTAFHAAFEDNAIADHETLSVSRGTSIILLIIYILYLVFQLKSHRYLYASTPQHIVDEESHPGVFANVFDSSSSSSDSSDDDSDSSSNSSQGTMRKKARRMVNKLRRKSSTSSHLNDESATVRGPSRNASVVEHVSVANHPPRQPFVDTVMSGDEADDDRHASVIRDFEVSSHTSLPFTMKEKRKHKHRSRKHRKQNHDLHSDDKVEKPVIGRSSVPTVQQTQQPEPAPTSMLRPYLPSLLSSNVFNNPQNFVSTEPAHNIRIAAAAAARAPAPLRRTKSMPEQIGDQQQLRTSQGPAVAPGAAAVVDANDDDDVKEPAMSIKAAIFMLLISTGLVAVCADFMSDAIEPMVESSGISAAFIGLIILPIVGNAAEHVTAITVAMKNKMDLAIGIAVGSSIQIALFITPLIVILGWCMGKSMTLYFNIFETICLFVAVLIVNFLILDGKSNYLEGSLLIGTYAIIALSSYFYPSGCAASAIGGNEEACAGTATKMARSVLGI